MLLAWRLKEPSSSQLLLLQPPTVTEGCLSQKDEERLEDRAVMWRPCLNDLAVGCNGYSILKLRR